jgi:hypothetical protein
VQKNIGAWRVVAKACFLFALFESIFFFSGVNLAGINVYRLLGLLRERFPFSTQAPADALLNVGNLDAMFASHVVSQPKRQDEYRVLVLGDSAVWGIRLSNEQTLPGQINTLDLMCGIKTVRAYNLGFPISSASKDLMILDRALAYRPDMILWLITWNTLAPNADHDDFLVSQNPTEFYQLGKQYDFLPRSYPAPTWIDQFDDRQRSLFHILQFQVYSLIQLAVGEDPIRYEPVTKQPTALSSDQTYNGLKPPTLSASQVSLDLIKDFYKMAGRTPVLMVNEPIQVLSNIPNSDIRYNDYYPRWIYDQYRQVVAGAASKNRWLYLDLWNALAPKDFANTPLHLSSEGERQFALILAPFIQKGCP